MRLLILLTVMCVRSFSFSQEWCGTQATAEQLEFMDKHISNSSGSDIIRGRQLNSTVNIPIQYFIIRRSDGSGGLPVSRMTSLTDEVNQVYIGSGLQFFQFNDPIEVNSDEFFNFDITEENSLALSRDVPGVVNIYIPGGDVTSNGSNLCGYTRFPPSTDRVLVAAGCATTVSTTAHELGHYFSLFHTHGKTNNGTTDELVDGSNCARAGDDVCDTPADPNLSGNVSGCTYTGNARDANGQTFVPDTRNIMSYAPSNCRSIFSNGQFNRASLGYQNGRNYLNVSFSGFTARFTSDARSGCSPSTIQFADESENVSSRRWSFEGGNISESAARIVNVMYEKAGRYDVSLTITNPNGESTTTTREGFIVINDPFENLIELSSEQSLDNGSLPLEWGIVNDDRLESFSLSSVTSDGFGNSLFMNNYSYESVDFPQFDDVLLSSFEVLDLRSFTLEFDYAYTFKVIIEEGLGTITTDTLGIGYVTDCSDEVNFLFELGGEDLSTAPASNSPFVPGATEWKTLRYEVSKENIRRNRERLTVRPTISNISYGGNNLYIDNVKLVPDYSIDSLEFFRGTLQEEDVTLRWSNPAINARFIVIEKSVDGSQFAEIAQVPAVDSEFVDVDGFDGSSTVRYRIKNINKYEESSYSKEVSFDVLSVERNDIIIYPNPTKGVILIAGKLPKTGLVRLVDMSGKVMIEEPSSKVESVDISGFPDGVYFMQVQSADGMFIERKIVKNSN